MRPIILARPTVLALFALLTLITSSTAAPPLARRLVEAVDLGTFGGRQTRPTAMNNRGAIVGHVRNATDNAYDAFSGRLDAATSGSSTTPKHRSRTGSTTAATLWETRRDASWNRTAIVRAVHRVSCGTAALACATSARFFPMVERQILGSGRWRIDALCNSPGERPD